MENFIMTESLRKKASQKVTLDILFVSDSESRLSQFRGESLIKSFFRFYDRVTNIKYTIAPSNKLAMMSDKELSEFNVLWLDNVGDFAAAMNISNVLDRLMATIDPSWKETAINLSKEDSVAGNTFMKNIIAKRQEKLRVIYALDEFVWQAPLARAKEVKRVQVIESLIDLADTVIVPNADLADFIQSNVEAKWVGFVRDNHDIRIIPTFLSPDFFPLYKNFRRTGAYNQLGPKPKVLIKGVVIPDNVQEFIMENFKKMEITICSVSSVNDHVMGLLQSKKVSHIMHWAHPHVNRRNMLDTLAIERDFGFDVVIHTKPNMSDLRGDVYEITTGDDDILFSIGYGAIPVCQTAHIGYDEEHLSNVSGFVFDTETPAKYLKNVVNSVCDVPVKFNEVYGKCRQHVDARSATSPIIMAMYFNAMIGTELAEARRILAEEAKTKMEEEQKTESEG